MNSFGAFPNHEKSGSEGFPFRSGERLTLRGLLAEDTPSDRYLVRKYLRDCMNFDFEVVEVDTVAETIKQLTDSRFDFLLLDLRLRDGEGSEVLEKMGRDFPLLPAIILTGFDQLEIATSSMRHGAQDYLTKDNLNSDILSRSIWYAIERHKVIEKLERAKEQVEAADRAKTEFLANMSHEMRTPLGVILASVDLVHCGDGKFDVGPESPLEMIRRNSQHLLSLVDGLLDISRLELGVLPTNVHRFHLMQEISPTLQSLELVAHKKGIEFEVTSTNVKREEIATDHVRLAQILYNVVGNAIKFTDRGKVSVDIQMLDEEPCTMRALVTDTGQGILPEHRPHLFKPFFQGDTSPARRYGGAGLGLALTKRVAKALGGDVRLVDSIPGKGSTFEITVLNNQQAVVASLRTVAEVEVPQAAGGGTKVPRVLEGVRVLVVEDCEDNQRIARFFLEGAGATVDMAGTAHEGITAVQEQKFDIVLMDIQLPGMDGYGAARELRNLGFSAPIVAVTAHAMEDEKEKCLAAGCDDYISKPYQYRTFLEKLSQLTARV